MICLLLAGVGLVVWLAARLYRQGRALSQEREENRRLRGLLQAGAQLAQTDLEQLRQLRHDLRQYLVLTADGGIPEEAAGALRDALAGGPAPGGESWAISALERHYARRAQELGLQADLHLTSPPGWEEVVPDLCLVLSNLLENSLEALQREKGGGWLRARSVCAKGYVSLVLRNTCTRPLRSVNGRYLSSKAPGRFGIGLETVEEVARRYSGQAEFSVEAGEFRASVFLARPAEQGEREESPVLAGACSRQHI